MGSVSVATWRQAGELRVQFLAGAEIFLRELSSEM